MARNRANPGPEKPVDDKVESELRQLEAADDTQFYNVDPEIERKVVRKLDCVILPLMVLVYFFQYLDKQTINQAAVFGLRSDLELTGTVSPAFIIITSIWYKRKEHPIRVATWVSMNGIANIIGALMMYGIGKGNMSLAPWRSLFLICGGLTSATGLLFIFLMPRDTTTAWFLSPQEREVATQRMAIDRATRDHAVFSKAQLKEALLSPMTWIYCLMGICITLTTPIMKYSSTVIHGFGYSTYKTMLVGTPAGAFNFITVWIGAIIPRVIPGTRVYTAIGLSIVPLLGSILLMTLPYSGGADWGIVVATWLGGCSSSLISSAASIIASNVKGNTKKSIVSTAFFVAYCVGCIVSPQAWTEDDAPRYTKGCILSIAAMACLILTFFVYVLMVKRLNRRRDRKASEGHFEYIVDRDDGNGRMGVSVDSDHTDVEDKAFRYTI
ncbi:hypothetical protein AtubIFM61612_003039 [Aspergillus tubingensis]|nr:hypothetical protein AtubIFM61612_003039 [Aspergillus tubingensis]